MGCILSLVVWLAGTVALFWFGSGATAETVATVIGAAVGGCFCVQCAAWLTSRARHRRLAAEYAKLYGPLPEEAKVVGTRVGGTVGRLLGGSTGYLIGGIAGAAVDVHAEAKKYEQMSDSQRALLQQLRQIGLVNPLLVSVLMVGAMLLSWVLVVAYEMARTIFGA